MFLCYGYGKDFEFERWRLSGNYTGFWCYFCTSVPNFCVLLAECADWLVMQGTLFSIEIELCWTANSGIGAGCAPVCGTNTAIPVLFLSLSFLSILLSYSVLFELLSTKQNCYKRLVCLSSFH